MLSGVERVRLTVLVSALLATLLVVLPDDAAPGSVTVLSAALALALSTALVSRAPLARRAALWADVSLDAPARDEKCRRGSFRRQSNPGAPGRVRPRAPQLA